MKKSLGNSITLAFGLIIILVVLMSTMIAQWNAEHQLDAFVSKIQLKDAAVLVGIVEVSFNFTKQKRPLNEILDTIQLQNNKNLFAEKSKPEWRKAVEQTGYEAQQTLSSIMMAAMQKGDKNLFQLIDYWHQAHHFVYRLAPAERLGLNNEELAKYKNHFRVVYGLNRQNEHNREEHERQEHGMEESHSVFPVYDWRNNKIIAHILPTEYHAYAEESNIFSTRTITNNVLGGIITAIFAFVAGLILTRRILQPVKALTQAAESLTAGKNNMRIEVNSKDELGKMSSAYNKMADTIAAQRNIRKNMIADISHELNTPLSIIRLEAQGMRDKMQPAEEAAYNILREIDHLGGLIADLELVAEVMENQLRLNVEAVRLSTFFESIAKRWRFSAQQQDLKLICTDTTTPPTWKMDKNRMRQVIDNLLRNAFRYTPAGGTVTLHSESDSSFLIITVTDTGAGMGQNEIKHIFERFYSEKTKSTHGSGLGLSIVKQIVELHNGKVEVVSRVNNGSKFIIKLPQYKKG